MPALSLLLVFAMAAFAGGLQPKLNPGDYPHQLALADGGVVALSTMAGDCPLPQVPATPSFSANISFWKSLIIPQKASKTRSGAAISSSGSTR